MRSLCRVFRRQRTLFRWSLDAALDLMWYAIRSSLCMAKWTFRLCPEKEPSSNWTVPLTLTLLRVLLIRAADQTFVVSNNYVHKLLRLRQNEVIWIGERPMIVIDNQPIHLDSFAHALSLRQPTGITWQGKRPVVVLRSEQRTAAFWLMSLSPNRK